jgi:hypothetical protein
MLQSVFHTAVDYPDKYGPRSEFDPWLQPPMVNIDKRSAMHQANLAASDGPVGPVPVPVM